MYREWATHREEGQLCPSCWEAPLVRVGQRLLCPACGEIHPAGWARELFAAERPTAIHGLPVGQGPLYATLQRYPHPGLSSPVLMDFVLDLDYPSLDRAMAAAQAYAEHLKGEPFRLYFSGSKGFHFVFPAETFGAKPHPEPHRPLRRLALALQLLQHPLDFKVYSPRRLFRVAHTRHPKTGLYKVPLRPEEIPYALELAKEPRRLSFPLFPSRLLGELYRQALAEPEPAPPPANPEPLRTRFPCMETLLLHGPPARGTRHALTLQLAAYMVRAGRPKEELLAWAREVPGASLSPERERVADAARAYDWAQKHQARFSCKVLQAHGLCRPDCPLRRAGKP